MNIKHRDWRKLEKWDWPQNRWTKIEFTCPHGIGHGTEVHGCDGCCAHPSFEEKTKDRRSKHEDK